RHCVVGPRQREKDGHPQGPSVRKPVPGLQPRRQNPGVGGQQGRPVKLWDVSTGKEQAVFKGHKDDARGGVHSWTFSPDGKTLASGADDGVKLWDVASGKEKATLEGSATYVAFLSGGRVLAWGPGDDSSARFWDVATGKVQKKLNTPNPRAIAVSP